MIIQLVYFFVWLRLRDETKIKNQSKQNKYVDPDYLRTMYNCMGHPDTTTEANEPIEVDDDVSHEACKNKESFSPVWPVYTRG
jgi:hypothetical protein